MNNPGLYTIEVDTYEKAISLLHNMQWNIDNVGYCKLKQEDSFGWISIVDPVIRQNGAKWILLVDNPIDLRGRI